MTHSNKFEGNSALEALFSEIWRLLGTVLSSIARILRLLWYIQMQVLNAVGLLSILQRKPWLFAVLAIVLLITFFPLGLLFTVTGAAASVPWLKDKSGFRVYPASGETQYSRGGRKELSPSEKMGVQAGLLVKSQIAQPFQLSKFEKNGQFIPPKSFYNDPYIFGFCATSFKMLIELAFNGVCWPLADKIEFLKKATETLSTSAEKTWKTTFKDVEANDETRSGAEAAKLVYLAMFGMIEANNDNPLVQEARKFAKSREGLMDDLHQMGLPGFEEKATTDDGLAMALYEITIAEHIRSKYL